jgi:hypothetical protein
MASIETKRFDQPDETRTPDKTHVEVVHLGDVEAGRFTFSPGWRWSECIKPVMGGESCQVDHIGVAFAGRITVVHEDGTTTSIGAGDVFRIRPGHDAWVEGDEDYVSIEFKGVGGTVST